MNTTSSTSNTPRTDKSLRNCGLWADPCIDPDFARELERENVKLHHRIASLEIKVDAFERVFERLRDCDWEISPLDRMDAVRDIARKALEWKEAQP